MTDKPAKSFPMSLVLIIGGILLVTLIIAGGIAYAFWGLATERQSSIPELLDQNVQFYTSFNPALSDLPNAARLQAAYPQMFSEEDPAALNDPLSELDMNFQQDIQPWLGAEVAVAVGNVPDFAEVEDMQTLDEAFFADTDIAILLASRDDEAAGAFLQKLLTNIEAQEESDITVNETTYKDITIYETTSEEEEQIPVNAFAVAKGVVIVANSDFIKRIIDQEPGGANSFANHQPYQQFKATMPDNAFSHMYIDGHMLRGLGEMMLTTAGQENLSPEQAEVARERIEPLFALESIGMSFGLANEGIFLESAYTLDMDAMSEANRIPFEYDTGDLSPRLERISDDAYALLTFTIQPVFKDQVLQAIERQPDGEQTLAMYEQMLELDLEEDLLNWLAGNASLVLLPAEEMGDITIPTTGYFALQPLDREAAENGLANIQSVLEQQAPLQTETIGAVEWNVVQEPQSGQIFGGFGFAGDDLVIAVGETALEAAASGNENPITADATFQTVRNNLPGPEKGMVYLDVQTALDVMEQAGLDVPQSGTEERQNLEPMQAFGLSGNPTEQTGVFRSRLFLLIQGNSADEQ
jgi:hypothetical protein